MPERSVLCDAPRCGMGAGDHVANETCFGPQPFQHKPKQLLI